MHHEYSISQDLSCEPRTNSISTQTDVSGSDMERTNEELDELRKKFADKDALLTELFVDKTMTSPKSVKTFYGLPNKEVFDG